jgi:hypothetical protein
MMTRKKREEPEGIDDFDPEDIDVQAIDGFHLGGNRFSASFELSDPDDEFSRSYLLEIEMAGTIRYGVRLMVEDAIRSHVSFAPQDHVALELGGIVHELPPGGADRIELPEGVLSRLWAPSRDRVLAYGAEGVSYVREGGRWGQLDTLGEAVMKDVDSRDGRTIYCVGNTGLLAQLQGRTWVPIDLATTQSFNCVHVGPRGEICIGGDEGLAYEYRGGELVTLQSDVVDYCDIIEFKGRRYWSDMNWGISVQEGDRIVPFQETGQGFTMSASQDFLVLAGWHEFFLFDGSRWTGFEMGWNGEIFLSPIDIADYES